MKAFITYIQRRVLLLLSGLLLLTPSSAYPAGLNSAKGCVVHKGVNDGLAILDEFVSYEAFGTLINFTDTSRNRFRVHHGENPIIIPYASDPEATSESAGKALARAMESAPHLRRRLDLIAKEWINRNTAEQAAKAKLALLPKPLPKAAPMKSLIPPLKTKSGEEFRDWSIASIEGSKALIRHADGSSSILTSEIPEESLRQDPYVKRLLTEGGEKEENGDLKGALVIYSQLGFKNEMRRIAEMPRRRLIAEAKKMEDSGDLKGALASYSQLELDADVKRVKEAQQKLSIAPAIQMEENGNLSDALEVYLQFGSDDDVKRVKEKQRRMLIADAQKMETALNWDKAIDLYRKASDQAGMQRAAKGLAQSYEAQKKYADAADAFEAAGLLDDAARIRREYAVALASQETEWLTERVFKEYAPACITIVAQEDGGNFSTGSGFYVARGGWILTNNHVIKNAKSVFVFTPEKKRMTATVIGKSDVPDIAILKIDFSDHKIVRIGDSDKVETGSSVSTIGTPDKLAATITAGIISSVSRIEQENECFQIDAAINHGSSGSPLFDKRGRCIGVCTFGRGTALQVSGGVGIGSDIQNVNFAIKINSIKPLLTKYKVPGF